MVSEILYEMDMEQARQRCLDEFSDILKGYTESFAPLTPSSRLIEDMGLDSFLMVYFLTQAEERFGIQIDETEYEHIVFVEDILDYIFSSAHNF